MSRSYLTVTVIFELKIKSENHLDLSSYLTHSLSQLYQYGENKIDRFDEGPKGWSTDAPTLLANRLIFPS